VIIQSGRDYLLRIFRIPAQQDKWYSPHCQTHRSICVTIVPDAHRSVAKRTGAIEWPTVAILIGAYAIWLLGTGPLWSLSPLVGLVATTIAIAQFSSLQHEVLHGHPFASRRVNEALVFPGLTLVIPYGRFRDTHLAHHYDPSLTDPYDDPESNYQDPDAWARLPRWVQRVLRLNNTLLGRMLLGPAVSIVMFVRGDLALLRAGDAAVRRAWVLHGWGVAMVLVWLLAFGAMPIWAYALAAYAGISLLKIRTFAEHRAHTAARARTVVIEDRGPLALLFLNNNLHSVHHMHPTVPWYQLPALYAGNRDHYLRRNEGYVFAGYGHVFRSYLFRAKDPVPHPVWPMHRLDLRDADPRDADLTD